MKVRISTGKAIVKRSGPFSELPDSETKKLLSSSPSRKSALTRVESCRGRFVACFEFSARCLVLELHTFQGNFVLQSCHPKIVS